MRCLSGCRTSWWTTSLSLLRRPNRLAPRSSRCHRNSRHRKFQHARRSDRRGLCPLAAEDARIEYRGIIRLILDGDLFDLSMVSSSKASTSSVQRGDTRSLPPPPRRRVPKGEMGNSRNRSSNLIVKQGSRPSPAVTGGRYPGIPVSPS